MSEIYNIENPLSKNIIFDKNLNYHYKINVSSEKNLILVTNDISDVIFDISLYENAKLNIFWMNKTTNGNHNVNFNITHKDKNTHSNLYFKNIIKGGNTKIYNDILIEQNIIDCSTHQSIKNLILNGIIECKPELRIHNDQVIASHGVSNKIISNDEIYYLQQRGLPIDVIYKEIENTFYEDILNKIDPTIRNIVNESIISNIQ